MSDLDIHSVPSGFHPTMSASPPDGAMLSSFTKPTLPNSAGVAKKRKNSKIRISPILKRATSTPQLTDLDVQEEAGLSPSAIDKRRNKLGYQRISIACSHCRRRKIRCVISEGDDLGRCNNCIRLKKECVFYPVDSAGGPESRAQPKSGMGSKSSSVISNSPSELQTSTSKFDHEHEIVRFPQLASNAPSEYSSLDPNSGLGITTSGTPIAPEYAFDPRYGQRPGWNHTTYAGDIPSTGPPTPVQWASSQMGGDLSTFSSTTTEHSPGLYPSYAFAHQREEFVGHQPLRSMSYGHIEPSLGSFPPQATAPIDFSRSGSTSHYTLTPLNTIAPVSGAMTEPSMTPLASEPSMTPMGMYPPQQWGYYPPQQQQQVPSMHLDYSNPRHDSLNTHWYHPSQLGPGPMIDHDPHNRQQHSMSQAPGSGYGKS